MTHTNNQPMKQLFPLLLLIFIDTVGYFIVIPIVLRLFMPGHDSILASNMTMGKRELLYSIALMLSPIAFIICSPLLGHLSDRYGRKPTLIVALIASIVGFILPIFGILHRSVSLILLGRFIEGASSSSQPLAQAAVTDFTQGKQRALYLSFIGFAMTLGMVIGPVSGSYLSDSQLVSWFNTTTPYWFALLLSVINLGLILQCYSDDAQHKASAVQQSMTLQLKGLWSIISEYRLGLLLLIFFLMEIGWSQYYQAIFLTMPQRFHYSIDQVSLFAAYIGLWMCVGLSVIYKLILRFASLQKIASFSLGIAFIGLALCNIPNVVTQWIFITLTAITIGTAYPSLLALMSDCSDDTHQGYVLGSASTMLGIAWMVTGLIAGPLVHVHAMLPMLVAALALLFSLLGMRANRLS